MAAHAERPSEAFLASDDRANEIADFIYLDPTAEPPLVQLIHVKGSGSDAASRQLSTSDYEIVVGQAVKNLRHLDQTNLADALADGSEHVIADATWQGDTRIGNRTALIAQLRKIGANYTREVYVVQPRVTDDELARCRREHTALLEDGGTLTNRVRRLRQLDTLLLGAAADCRELGADFYVIGQATGRPCPTHGA